LEHAPALLRDALNANVKIVSGYKGSADIRLAIDSGEIGGFFNPWSTIKPTAWDKFKSGEWLVLAQLTDQPLRDLPATGIPTIPDLTKDEAHRSLLRFGASRAQPIRQSLYAPAGGFDRARGCSGNRICKNL
jgi:hypothetical protein